MASEEDYLRLRQTVTNLLLRIEENQQIQARFHDYEFQLLGCRRLSELLQQLFDGASKHFELVSVSLVLYDPDYAIAGLLDHLKLGDFDKRLQLTHTVEFFVDLYQSSPRVKLGTLDKLQRERLFPCIKAYVGSAALMPWMERMVRASSPSMARRALTFWTNWVEPSAPDWSKIS